MMLRLTTLQVRLAVLCAMLCVLIVAVLAMPLPQWQVPPVAAPPAQTVAAQTDGFRPPSADAFDAIDARPVFSPTRAPLRNAGSLGDGAGTATFGDLTLVGIIADNTTRLAVLRVPGHPLAVTVALGGTVDGWQVSEIDADRVVVRGRGSEQELRMSQPRAPH